MKEMVDKTNQILFFTPSYHNEETFNDNEKQYI